MNAQCYKKNCYDFILFSKYDRVYIQRGLYLLYCSEAFFFLSALFISVD